MKNVQLLVVDRHSLETGKPTLCNVGESGEIFVRAGGKTSTLLEICGKVTESGCRACGRLLGF